MTLRRELTINLICRRIPIHAGPSGYDRLADFLEARVLYTRPVSQWSYARRALMFKFLNPMVKRSGSQWYRIDSLNSELHAALQWFRKSGQIFHFFYGEHSYRYLGNLKSKGCHNFVVCTYHTPKEKFQSLVKERSHLSKIDAVIVVSTSQMEFFSQQIGADKVFYVPHGIDVEYFKPRVSQKNFHDDIQCLFVGAHLRDFETLAQSARILCHSRKHIKFAVVIRQKFHHYFQGLNNVELFSGISDEKLLELYQCSDIFVFPLLDATANNSLLEALACGLPIVSTDLAAVRDYVDETCALFTPKRDPKAFAEAILYLAEDEGLRENMALASRALSIDFSWEKIASQIKLIYSSTVAQ